MVINQQGKELDMDLIKQIAKLDGLGFSQNKISNNLGISKGSVNKYIKLLNQEGSQRQVSDSAIENILSQNKRPPAIESCKIDFSFIDKELAKKGVTLKLLHAELSSSDTTIGSYSNFCLLYRTYKKQQDICLRQTYKGGEILYVDYSGLTIPVADFDAEIFVCVLAASNYIYAEASRDQKLSSWINSHRRAFEFYGGVPKIWVPDNLKSGVTKADKYSPLINKTYQEFAFYYNGMVIPTRSYSPRDKGKVEVSVQIIQRHIIAKLRNEKFSTLQELNAAIKILLQQLNNLPFQKLAGNRYSLFKELDEPYLIPLPACPYEYAEYEKQTVGKDYHVRVGDKYYSVPYVYARKVVEVKKTLSSIEIIYKGQRISVHPIAFNNGSKYVTDASHLPEKHRVFSHCQPNDIVSWAKDSFAVQTVTFIENIISNSTSSLEAYKKSGAIKRLAKKYGATRIDKAAARLAQEGVFSFSSLESILANSLESGWDQTQDVINIEHTNLRGREYYNQ